MICDLHNTQGSLLSSLACMQSCCAAGWPEVCPHRPPDVCDHGLLMTSTCDDKHFPINSPRHGVSGQNQCKSSSMLNLSIISWGPWSIPIPSRSSITASKKASSQNCTWSHRVERSLPEHTNTEHMWLPKFQEVSLNTTHAICSTTKTALCPA